MYTSPLTLDNVDGSDVTYSRISSELNGSRFIDTATNLSAPKFLIFKHSTQGKSPSQVDRHLVQFQLVVLDSSGAPQTVTANFTLAVPRSSAVTTTMVKNLAANLVDFLDDGALTSLATTVNLDSLLRGET